MAKQRPKPTDDMEIQAIKDHLVRQDKMWADEKKKSEEITDRLYELIKEINTILGGSAALGVAGMRQDVKDLKTDVQKLKQSESERGKWIINISSIHTFRFNLEIIDMLLPLSILAISASFLI